MSERRLPLGEGSVPDKALEELLAAFANDQPAQVEAIDFDDPSIDRLLGLDGPPADVDGSDDTDDAPVAEPDARPEDGPSDEPVLPREPRTPDPVTIETETQAPPAPSAPASSGAEPSVTAPAVPAAPAPRTTIKIGGDADDFPDAVYLDEEASERLRGSGRATEASVGEGRTTILIADDDHEGAVGGIPTATGSASMDPRLRARRIAVKRAVGRRRLKWFVLAAVIITVLTAGFAVLGSSLFAVNDLDDIAISGARRIAKDDLDAAIDQILDHPVLLIDTTAIERQLEKSPWVREARVRTDFPHNASIEILERVPLATYAGPDGRFRIIDVEGQVVDVIQNQPVEFMLVTGNGVNASPGTAAGPGFTHAAELVEALSPAVRSRTASIAVSDSGGLSLLFHNGATVVLGAPTELLDKLTRLEAFLKRDSDVCTTTIDVSTNEIGQCG